MKYLSFIFLLLPHLLLSQAKTQGKVKFYGSPGARISAGVAIPPGKGIYVISGIVASPMDSAKQEGSFEKYGDTKTQAISILSKIENQLKEAGLSMKDVVNLKAFVVQDKRTNVFDFNGWNEAYDIFFNNQKNPLKPTRITVGIPGLTNPGYLIEIEGMAVFP